MIMNLYLYGKPCGSWSLASSEASWSGSTVLTIEFISGLILFSQEFILSCFNYMAHYANFCLGHSSKILHYTGNKIYYFHYIIPQPSLLLKAAISHTWEKPSLSSHAMISCYFVKHASAVTIYVLFQGFQQSVKCYLFSGTVFYQLGLWHYHSVQEFWEILTSW